MEEGEEGEEGAGFWSSHALKKAHNEVHRLSVSAICRNHMDKCLHRESTFLFPKVAPTDFSCPYRCLSVRLLSLCVLVRAVVCAPTASGHV